MTTFAGHIYGAFTVPSSTTISVTTNAGGPTSVTVTAGTYESVAALCTQLQADLISQRSVSGGTWAVSVSTTTGLVTIAVTNGTYSITWTSTTLRDLLGFAGNISSQSTQTGTKNARGLWIPDATAFVDGRIGAAPISTDARQTRSPTGFAIGHVGNVSYQHQNFRYSHTASNRVWIADETTGGGVANQSLEQFLKDTQWGQGHAWFTPTSKLIIVAHDGTELGGGTVAGWYLVGCRSMADVASRAVGGWDGYWAVQFPLLITDS